ncbi:MAG TPA: hypothetical protein DCG48_01590 [Rhodospirillaceae bacterium]|nr:hypothetical protein [Rhodospirillaceae bacterium]
MLVIAGGFLGRLLSGVHGLLRQRGEGGGRAGHHLGHLRHGFGDLGVGGHALHVVLPQVQVLLGQLVQIRLVGHGGVLPFASGGLKIPFAPAPGEHFIAAQQRTR